MMTEQGMAKAHMVQVKIKWVSTKASPYACALSSKATGMVCRSHVTSLQHCLKNANRISAENEIRKLNLNVLFQLNGLTCGFGTAKHSCSPSGA